MQSTDQRLEAPILTPWPGPQSAVILDNCAIHHDEDVRQKIEVECGTRCPKSAAITC